MEEARKIAKAEGVAVNQLINVVVAEKVSARRTEEYFAEGAAKGDIEKALYYVNCYGFTAVFPWFAAARHEITAFARGIFGLTAAWAYYGLRRPTAIVKV